MTPVKRERTYRPQERIPLIPLSPFHLVPLSLFLSFYHSLFPEFHVLLGMIPAVRSAVHIRNSREGDIKTRKREFSFSVNPSFCHFRYCSGETVAEMRTPSTDLEAEQPSRGHLPRLDTVSTLFPHPEHARESEDGDEEAQSLDTKSWTTIKFRPRVIITCN